MMIFLAFLIWGIIGWFALRWWIDSLQKRNYWCGLIEAVLVLLLCGPTAWFCTLIAAIALLLDKE